MLKYTLVLLAVGSLQSAEKKNQNPEKDLTTIDLSQIKKIEHKIEDNEEKYCVQLHNTEDTLFLKRYENNYVINIRRCNNPNNTLILDKKYFWTIRDMYEQNPIKKNDTSKKC